MSGNEKMRSFGIRVFSFFFVLFLSGFWIQGGGLGKRKREMRRKGRGGFIRGCMVGYRYYKWVERGGSFEALKGEGG